jgi:hypothetical protein
MSQVIYGVLALGLCFLLLCRTDKMLRGLTRPAVFYQHAVLALSVFASWVLGFTRFAEWSEVVFAAGVLQFFLFSVDRWRMKAPSGTERKPTEIPAEMLKHVHGRGRD